MTKHWMVLTVDVDVGIRVTVAMFVADVALYHLGIFRRDVNERQVVPQTAKSPRIFIQLCTAHYFARITHHSECRK